MTSPLGESLKQLWSNFSIEIFLSYLLQEIIMMKERRRATIADKSPWPKSYWWKPTHRAGFFSRNLYDRESAMYPDTAPILWREKNVSGHQREVQLTKYSWSFYSSPQFNLIYYFESNWIRLSPSTAFKLIYLVSLIMTSYVIFSFHCAELIKTDNKAFYSYELKAENNL